MYMYTYPFPIAKLSFFTHTRECNEQINVNITPTERVRYIHIDDQCLTQGESPVTIVQAG